jgi:hypothetical protein
MVKYMVEGYSTEARLGSCAGQSSRTIECHTVDSRLSRNLEDVGRVRGQKLLSLFGYCLRALWLRVRHNAPNLYFVPAAPIRASLYRDWLVMLICRGFFCV